MTVKIAVFATHNLSQLIARKSGNRFLNFHTVVAGPKFCNQLDCRSIEENFYVKNILLNSRVLQYFSLKIVTFQMRISDFI